MSAWLAPPLLPALIVMVSFALIPRRLWFIQPPAVIGWTIVWTDNRITGGWLDMIGLTMVVTTVAVPVVRVLIVRQDDTA